MWEERFLAAETGVRFVLDWSLLQFVHDKAESCSRGFAVRVGGKGCGRARKASYGRK